MMKNKKVIASLLGIACVAILIGVVAMTPKTKHTFTPEVTETASNDSWEEKYTSASSEQGTPPETDTAPVTRDGSADDKTQTVVTEDDKTVVTELTPAAEKEKVQTDTKPTSPPADSEKHGRLPSCDIPDSEPAPTSAPQPTAPDPEPVTEAPQSGGHEGQVYDPVFGWMTPGAAEGQVIDNDGDVNKQVGTMN